MCGIHKDNASVPVGVMDMKDYVLQIIHMNNDFTGNGMFMALYLVTLLFVAFFVDDKRLKNAILYSSVILLVFVYLVINAANYLLALNYIEFNDEVKGRFVWLFMIPAIAALGCTLMVSSLKKGKDQLILTIALVPVIFLCGVFQITDYRFGRADNLYKLPQEFIDIADTVLDEQKKAGEDTASLIVPYETAYSFRQYTTDIELLYGEDATFGRIYEISDERRDVCDTMQTTCPDLSLILNVADKYDTEYIIFDCTYVDFGLESINSGGYSEDENFVGDRTPDPDVVSRMADTVRTDGEKNAWDLSQYGLEYEGTFGRYLLYKFV